MKITVSCSPVIHSCHILDVHAHVWFYFGLSLPDCFYLRRLSWCLQHELLFCQFIVSLDACAFCYSNFDTRRQCYGFSNVRMSVSISNRSLVDFHDLRLTFVHISVYKCCFFLYLFSGIRIKSNIINKVHII